VLPSDNIEAVVSGVSGRGNLAPSTFGQLHSKMVDSVTEFGMRLLSWRSEPQRTSIICNASQKRMSRMGAKMLKQSRCAPPCLGTLCGSTLVTVVMTHLHFSATAARLLESDRGHSDGLLVGFLRGVETASVRLIRRDDRRGLPFGASSHWRQPPAASQ
jgi:hypothetical protein